ncbi:hypothetical protein BGZ68_006189, partial [Mortierella alpina]
KDPDSDNWNYSAPGNLNKAAKELVAASKNSGLSFGICSTPGVWSSPFGSRNVVL